MHYIIYSILYIHTYIIYIIYSIYHYTIYSVLYIPIYINMYTMYTHVRYISVCISLYTVKPLQLTTPLYRLLYLGPK